MSDVDSFGTFLLSMVIPVLTGFLARRKGYNFFIWMFAAGCIGLLCLACLPYATDSDKDEPEQAAAQARLRKTGNTIGGVLAGISIGIGLILVLA